jgi:hypothetical protein
MLTQHFSGKLCISGVDGKIFIVVAAVSAFLGDNPCQSEYCSQKKMTTRANCCMCTRVKSDPLAHFGRFCIKSATIQQLSNLRQLSEDARDNTTLTVL